MYRIYVNPLSVNKAYRGRRFKTQDYKDYELFVLNSLPNIEIPQGDLFLNLNVGFSSCLSDLDNCIKLILDILQKKYNFNDKKVFALFNEKEIVKKGEEYFKFELLEYKTLHERVLSFIRVVRGSFDFTEEVYTRGSCYQFYEILKEVFPCAECYYNADHVITKIGYGFYDIKGEVSGDRYLPIKEYGNQIKGIELNLYTKKTFLELNKE